MYNKKKITLISLIMVTISEITFASDKKTGLPQLDFNTYPSLIFWSIISLVIGYFLMAYLVTPQIKSIINLRETNIQNDLIKAKTSNEESEKINFRGHVFLKKGSLGEKNDIIVDDIKAPKLAYGICDGKGGFKAKLSNSEKQIIKDFILHGNTNNGS
jgi:F-type H+-transporting ATPase subunit b